MHTLDKTYRDRSARLALKRLPRILSAASLLLMLAAFPATSADLRFEASMGRCGYGLSEKGSWWNDHYETNIDRIGSCWQIGLSQAPWKWGRNHIGWRVAWVRFPDLATNSVMAGLDEDQFNHPDGSECAGNGSLKNCTIRVTGGGRAQGISIGPLIERKFGPTTWGLEAGLFFYHNEFDVTVSPGPHNPDAFTPYQWNHAEGWRRKPYGGLTFNYHYLFVAARYYHQLDAQGECAMCSGATGGGAWQWTAGVSIPLP